MIFIYHHLGLGDHIVCNGLVRHLYNKFNNVSLFCYHHNLNNLKYMYRDLLNLNLIPMSSDNEIEWFIKNKKIDVLKIGFSKMGEFSNNNSFDEAFYKIANVPFNVRYDEFYIERDTERELFVYNEMNPSNEKYIFIHDDPNRGFNIDNQKYRKDLRVIRNDNRFNIFEMMRIYENAEEIHFMESSISALINSYTMKNPKLFLHKYIRNYDVFGHTKSRNNIIIVE